MSMTPSRRAVEAMILGGMERAPPKVTINIS